MDQEEAGDYYDRAVAIVTREKKVSVSYIQRRLSVGYNKAASLIERMEKEGVVSAPRMNAGAMDCEMTCESWEMGGASIKGIFPGLLTFFADSADRERLRDRSGNANAPRSGAPRRQAVFNAPRRERRRSIEVGRAEC